jgi:hypothetical protein
MQGRGMNLFYEMFKQIWTRESHFQTNSILKLPFYKKICKVEKTIPQAGKKGLGDQIRSLALWTFKNVVLIGYNMGRIRASLELD